jgi:hypothetical protein
MHRLVLDARFLEARPAREEAVLEVEVDRGGLRVQRHFVPAPLARQAQQRRQHRRADPMAAPRCEYRHAADARRFVAYGRHEATRADRLAGEGAGHDVRAGRIQRVALQRRGNVLLMHEHGFADRVQFGHRERVFDGLHAERGRAGAAWRVERREAGEVVRRAHSSSSSWR